jgi:hypothetical protein
MESRTILDGEALYLLGGRDGERFLPEERRSAVGADDDGIWRSRSGVQLGPASRAHALAASRELTLALRFDAEGHARHLAPVRSNASVGIVPGRSRSLSQPAHALSRNLD